ncbi:hypothetical protein HYV98_00805, partial [Candidatus Azambacteria bacterium]|nr:hypothetical protein [Candidatus Azambacteria bacterium]
MPELPEVETTVRQLKNAVVGKTLRGFWTDWAKYVKPMSAKAFGKAVVGRKILNVSRRGKNILFSLSGGPPASGPEAGEAGKTMLIHQKLTGHLLVGKWKLRRRKQVPVRNGAMRDRVNTYIHLLFDLNGKQLALSDLRKFGKVRLYSSSEVDKAPDLALGPDPLIMSYDEFTRVLKKRKTRIKALLLDQTAIAGIGNIYSDEILWLAKVHPLKS